MTKAKALPLEAVRAHIDELVALWSVDNVERISMLRRDGQIVGLTLYGLAAHAYSLARAIRILDAAGEGAQVVPLTRQLLECAMTALWVETFGLRAAVKIQREEARSRVAVFKAFVETGTPDDGTVAQWEGELARLDTLTTKPSEKLYQRCEEVEGMLGGYSMYRALSALSHAGGMIVDLYVEPTPATVHQPDGGLRLATHPKEWARDAVLGLALVYLLHAAMALDRNEKIHPRRTRLKQIAAEMNMKLDWSPTAIGLKRQHEWEKDQKTKRRSSQKDR